MYEDAALESMAARLLERQDDPVALLEDLRAVKQQHEEQGIPEELQRYQLNLELDADDFAVVVAEVEDAVYAEVEAAHEGEDDQ